MKRNLKRAVAFYAYAIISTCIFLVASVFWTITSKGTDGLTIFVNLYGEQNIEIILVASGIVCTALTAFWNYRGDDVAVFA